MYINIYKKCPKVYKEAKEQWKKNYKLDFRPTKLTHNL